MFPQHVLDRQSKVADPFPQLVGFFLKRGSVYRNTGILEASAYLLANKSPKRTALLDGVVDRAHHALELLADRAHADQSDEGTQHVIGAFPDHVNPGIPHHTLVRFIGEISLAAEDLNRVVD